MRFLAIICTLGLITMVLSSQAQQTPKSFLAYEKYNQGYLEYLPPGYATATGNFPVIIFLHGSGEAGNGSPEELQRVASWGPPSHIKNGHDMCFDVNSKKECFVVISPQMSNASYGWDYIVAGVIDHLLNGPDKYKVDPNRIYLTGLSLGGGGVYNVASSLRNRPNKIAAIAPMAGFSEPYDDGCVISARKIPVWAFHGKLDQIVPIQRGLTAFNKVKFCGNPQPTAEMIFTTYEDRYHDAWIPGYDPSHDYHNPNLYEWFLQKSLPQSDETVTANEQDPSETDALLIYPNPCLNELILEAQHPEQLPSEISILNMTGDVLLDATGQGDHINISQLNSGVYILRYKDEDGLVRSQRLVKL